jgi:precorrin-6B methylase 1
MDPMNNKHLKNFVELLISRGLGLYGQKEMAKICYESGIALTDLNEIEWMTGKHEKAVQSLLVNYGTRNLPAKMTVMVLARKHNIPLPEKLTKKKRNKKQNLFKRIFKRK